MEAMNEMDSFVNGVNGVDGFEDDNQAEQNGKIVQVNIELFISDLLKPMLSSDIKRTSKSITFPRLFDCENKPYLLQPSIFTFVPPTVYFTLEQQSCNSSNVHYYSYFIFHYQ